MKRSPSYRDDKYDKRRKKQEEQDDEKQRRRIIILIIIIIILLSLITSCSCTSNFFGKIGNWFQNEGDHPINSGTNHQEVIRNRELKFDSDDFRISLSDSKAKLSYSYKGIHPKEFTCTTSDAKIATCYVQDGYVVINPKKTGKVTVTLQTSVNGKTYEATTTVTITDPTKYIQLSSTSGTINLAYQKELKVPYSLVGLTGKVKVTSSDEGIAKATVKDGVLIITANKTGKVDITLSLTYNGVEYTTVYKLTVINDKNNTGNSGSKDPSKPGEVPSRPSEEKKDNNSKLRELNLSWIDLGFTPDKYEYRIGVSSWRRSVKLSAVPQSRKAKIISYTFNGKTVSTDEINKLKLRTGENIITVTVQAEDGTTSTYKVILDKAKSSNNFLKSLGTSKGELDPKFDKNRLDYAIEVGANVGAITLTPVPKSKKATLTYTLNGITTTSLKNLNLRTGPNVVKIKVTSEDGSSRTYKVTINRKTAEGVIDKNSLLKELTDSLGKIDFDPYQTNYTIGVDKDTEKIHLTAKPSSKNATVTYEFNGKVRDDLSNLDLLPGNNTVKIIVTAADGVTKTEYTVVINKETSDESNTLTNVKVIGGKAELEPAFDSNTLNYQINVDAKTSKLGLEVTPHSRAKDVIYTYKGQTITKEELANLPLEYGDNEVVVTVVGSDDTTRNYTFTIHRKSDKSSDTSLKSLTVDGKSILDSYMETVDVTVNSVQLKAVPNDKNATLTYLYEGVEYSNIEELQVNLKPGVNTVEIKVTAEDGFTTQIYEVTLVQAERRVRFTKAPNTCYIEDDCLIEYVVEDIDSKTGTVFNTVTESVQDSITTSVTPSDFSASKVAIGQVRITPDASVMPGSVATLTVGVDGFTNSHQTVAVTFIAHDYHITSPKYEYDMTYNDKRGGTRSIILNTQLFKGDITVNETTSSITFCSSERPGNCVTVQAEGPIEISYTGETTGPTSLPIAIKATGTGTATLHVTGTAYGKNISLPSEVADSKIKINITRSYLVTVKAYDGSFDTADQTYTGLFNTLTKEYEFVLEENGVIDLAKYDEPYLEINDKCLYHPFKGYKEEHDPDQTIRYDRTTNSIIRYSDLSDDLTLVAVYDMENKETLERIDQIMWLSDVPLFYNEESDKMYAQPKMIYPRSYGKYTMNITNETTDTIVISGMILQENTICMEGTGCLNMGYIIKDYKNNYHFGGSNDYWILNSYGQEEATEVYKYDFDFQESTNNDLTLQTGETLQITLHWKWVDYEDGHTDRLDTLIGNKAAELESTDLLYKLAVGIKYTTIKKECGE